MALNNPYDHYRQNAVMYANQGDLVMMLYNGAVNFVRQAVVSIDQNSLEGANNALIKTQNIISYLTETLNFDYQISHNLAGLYFYINRRLAEANIKKDKEILNEVLDLLEDLRGTWREAISKNGNPG